MNKQSSQLPKNAIATFLAQTKVWAEKNTIASYEARLNRFADFAKSRALNTRLILEYKAYLGTEPLKESTVAGHFVVLKLFFAWALKMELINKDPMPERMGFVIAPSERVPITSEERDKLIAKAEQMAGYEFWADAINTAWHTGLRLCDVALMRRESLNVPNSSIKLIPKKTSRYARIVDIPVPVELIHRLNARSTEGEFVFPEMQRHYARDLHKSLSAQFCYLGKLAEVKKGFHCFRNTAITRWLNDGVPPHLVSSMTGINLNQIMTYAKPSLETKREALGLNLKETA